MAVMRKLQDDNPSEMASKTESHLRYGISRSKSSVEPPKPQQSKPSAQKMKPLPDAGYSYDDFQQLLKGQGRSTRVSRPLSDNLLPRGSLLPLPRNFASLEGVPNSFASIEALAGKRRTFVLIASGDTYLAERLRSTLLAFDGQLQAEKLDASLACVSRAPPSSLRKLARKAKVSMPLLSDPDGAWLGKLDCDPSGEVSVVLVDSDSTKVIMSFSGASVAPSTLVQTVAMAIERRDELEAAAAPPPAAPPDDIPDSDELPDEWAFAAAGPQQPAAVAPAPSPPPPPAPKPSPPPIAIPKPEITFRPAAAPPPSPAPAPAPPPPPLAALEAENEKLRAALRAVEEKAAAEAAASRMREENERLKAQLEAAEAATTATRAAQEAQQRQQRAAEDEKRRKAAKAASQAAAKAAKRPKDVAGAGVADAERADLVAQLEAAQEAAAAEAAARQDAEKQAETQASAAREATEAARVAASAAAKAAAAASALAAKQQAAPQPPPPPPPPPPPAAPEGPSLTARAGEAVPADLPLAQLQPVTADASAPASLAELVGSRGRLVLLFGRLDSPALSEALRFFEREFVPKSRTADARLVGVGVGDAPAVFSSALRRAATSLSYPLYLDREGALLSSLGYGQLADGLEFVVVGGLGEGDSAEGASGTLIGAFGASGNGASGAALRSILELFEQVPPPTFASDPALDTQWKSLLSAIERPGGEGGRGGRGAGRGARGRGRVVRGRGRMPERPPPRVQSWPRPEDPGSEFWGGSGSTTGGNGLPGWSGTAATPDRPLGVWLPGLKRVSRLLNGTAGVVRVASSKIYRVPAANASFYRVAPTNSNGDSASLSASAEGAEVGGDRDGGDGDDDERAGRSRRSKSVTWGRLAIRFDGEGNFNAVRLRASFENHRSPLRSQLLYVTCEDSFSLEELREVLRALQPVLDFVLVE